MKTSPEPGPHGFRMNPGIVDLPGNVSVLARPDQGSPYCRKTDEEFLQRTPYHLTTLLWMQCSDFQVMENTLLSNKVLLFHITRPLHCCGEQTLALNLT